MTFLLPALAVAFAAFCVWLTVRIVNRRERWAKWTLAGVVGVPVLYVASFGPACWFCEHGYLNQNTAWIVFRPITWSIFNGPAPASRLFLDYAKACGDRRRVADDWEVRLGMPKKTYVYRGKKCRSDSVSPIDYEFTRITFYTDDDFD